MGLTDKFSRNINYLRLSITDRCNMRCRYCMPDSGVEKIRHGDVLSYEELLTLARAAVSLGIEKIRVTGGEPLVRKGVTGFLRQLADIPGLNQLVLTTNGLLLADLARELKDAGVQRINISLDSLNPDTFREITRGADLKRVLAGIESAMKLGFPVKLNAVIMRGVNDHEILDFAAMTLYSPLSFRFIEYMPAIKEEGWQRFMFSGKEILDRIGEKYSIVPLQRASTCGPARNYRIAGALGSIGIITPLSGHFCEECNRIRVTSSGMAQSCLFSEAGLDLKAIIRGGAPGELEAALADLVSGKPERHDITGTETPHKPFAMSGIGG